MLGFRRSGMGGPQNLQPWCKSSQTHSLVSHGWCAHRVLGCKALGWMLEQNSVVLAQKGGEMVNRLLAFSLVALACYFRAISHFCIRLEFSCAFITVYIWHVLLLIHGMQKVRAEEFHMQLWSWDFPVEVDFLCLYVSGTSACACPCTNSSSPTVFAAYLPLMYIAYLYLCVSCV